MPVELSFSAKVGDSLEAEFGERLERERLYNQTASRTAIYRVGITMDAPHTEEIKEWAIDRLLQFKAVFGPKLPELVR